MLPGLRPFSNDANKDKCMKSVQTVTISVKK